MICSALQDKDDAPKGYNRKNSLNMRLTAL